MLAPIAILILVNFSLALGACSGSVSYKKAKGIPAKTDEEKQKAFIETCNKELKDKPSDEPVVFMDAAHPTMATKLSHVSVRKGTEKQIKTAICLHLGLSYTFYQRTVPI